MKAKNQENKKILNVTQRFQETARSLTNFFRPGILPAAHLTSSSKEASGNSPVTRDVEKEEEMKIKRVVVSRGLGGECRVVVPFRWQGGRAD